MLWKYYNNNTLSTLRPTQKVATCQILSAKMKINMANEPLKVQQSLLESSSEMDKLPCITNAALSAVTKITCGEKFSFSRILSDGDFQLTAPSVC